MKKNILLVLFFSINAVLLGSCEVVKSTPIPTTAPPALSAQTIPSSTFTPTKQPKPSSISSLQPTSTPSPTAATRTTFTPQAGTDVPACPTTAFTTSSVYLDETLVNGLRQGPGCQYPLQPEAISTADPIAFYPILGKMHDWWLVQICAQSAWIFGPAVWKSNLRGEAETIPAITAAPPSIILSTLSPTISTQDSLKEAGRTLTAFFEALQAKEYDQAAAVFGGGYGIVRMWNEDVDPHDYPSLLMRGCEWNGFICSLTLSQIIQASAVSDAQFEFTVEFYTADGQLFQLHNMADPNAPPKSTFRFTVIRDCQGRYFVIDWPIYIG